MHLTSTSDRVKVTLTASGDIDVHCSWMEQGATGDPQVKRKNTNVTTTTPADAHGAMPDANTAGKIKFLNLYNDHASNNTEATISHTDGTTEVKIDKFTLAPGERWTYGSEPDV